MLTLLFHYTFSGGNPARGLALGFDVDMEPVLWWQRKPKAISETSAKAKVAKVARVIVEKAQEAAAERVPEAQRRGEVRAAVKPLLDSMPGFDWRPMWEEAYSRALTALIGQQMAQRDETERQAKAEAARRRQIDEDEIALLVAAFT
jgi:hypothetical protein